MAKHITIPDDKIRDQFRSEECMENIIANRELLYGNVPDRYARNCTNKHALSGWNINEYDSKSIFTIPDEKEEWCFRYDEIQDLIKSKKNPYTGKSFTQDQIAELDVLRHRVVSSDVSLPLTEQLRDIDLLDRCPLWRSTDPLIVYSYVCPWQEESMPNAVYYNVNAAVSMSKDVCIGRLYKITLKRPLNKRNLFMGRFFIEKTNVAKMEVVKEGRSLEKTPRPKPEEQIDISVNDYPPILGWTFNETFDMDELKKFYELNLRPPQPITLYRGFRFGDFALDIFLKSLGKTTLTVEDTFDYKPKKAADSWTTNVCLATAFAMTFGENGIVIKYTAKPNEIILDTRYIRNMRDFYKEDQAEVILTNYPIVYSKGELKVSAYPYIRKVEVYLITKHNDQWVKTIKSSR